MNIFNTPRVIAHRGCGVLAKQNSMEGIEFAINRGVQGIEIDTHSTKDGMLVMHHDTKLADGRQIMDLTIDELPHDLTRLRDVVHYCTIRNVWINIEVKFEKNEERRESDVKAHLRARAMGRAAAELLRQFRVPEKPCAPRNMVSSFSLSVLAGAESVDDNGDDIIIAAVSYKVLTDHSLNVVLPVGIHHLDLLRLVKRYNVWVWGNPTQAEAAELYRAGVIGIITDRPELL